MQAGTPRFAPYNQICFKFRWSREVRVARMRQGGIVAAVSLSIALAFVGVILFFSRAVVNATTTYAEEFTDIFANDLVDTLNAKAADLGIAGSADKIDSGVVRELSQVLDAKCSLHKQEAALADPEETIILESVGTTELGSNLFESDRKLQQLRDELVPEKDNVVHCWLGLDGLIPHEQRLYDVRYVEGLGLYLVSINHADALFQRMREQVAMLALALSVVFVLVLVLVSASIRSYRRRLIRAATTDELTGLANRKSFSSSYERMGRAGKLDSAMLVLVDVDFFKRINDSYGHAEGDRALAAVAAEVRAMVGDDGLAGRWGGDEMIGVIVGTHEQAAERARDMVRRVAALELDEGLRITVSAGGTDIEADLPLNRVVEQADAALYEVKEAGRGAFLAYQAGVTSGRSYETEGTSAAGQVAGLGSRAREASSETIVAAPDLRKTRHDIGELVVRCLLLAVRRMVPFVAGGGILIAIAFLVDGVSVDLNTLAAAERANFGSITPVAATLHDVGAAAFNFMLPIFAAFLAQGIADEDAFMAGFAGGYLASQGTSGFLGAILAAVIAGTVVRLMKSLIEDRSPHLQRAAPIIIYPIFSLLIMYALVVLAVDPLATAFDAWLTSILEALVPGGRVVLGAASAAMMATDMGGPINKAAYHFGTAAIASGRADIMAAVMVGGMVPPCGIALSCLIFRDCFSEAERDQALPTLLMGISFITEGAIPYALTDLVRVIPSCMLGSAVAGALSEAFGCTLMAPHGGIFVFPVVGGAALYVIALAVGSFVCAITLGLLKRRRVHSNE